MGDINCVRGKMRYIRTYSRASSLLSDDVYARITKLNCTLPVQVTKLYIIHYIHYTLHTYTQHIRT